MIFHRITTKPYINDLSGTGAMLYGGRWNKKGIRVLYTSESLSLAVLETIANLSSSKLNNLYCVELDFPGQLEIQPITNPPKQWNAFPYTYHTVDYGTKFIKQGGLCLKVPSSIIPTEHNYLLNPLHDDYYRIKVIDARPFLLDQRFMK
ncbi:MAG: RES family NAD+ phosphorylase [Cyclobacteriaceae bacterium]|nr:RES family NAD+ phosphorylase [Cyclobacteriaceae bacterium]